jgi:hypothetical protein
MVGDARSGPQILIDSRQVWRRPSGRPIAIRRSNVLEPLLRGTAARVEE